MKKLIVLCCAVFFMTASAFASVNGDPVQKVVSELEKASITLTTDQKTAIENLYTSTFRNQTSKTTGQKGTRKGTMKREKRSFKKSVYETVLTDVQRQKFDTYKGR
jgi:hypothetical protein